jgi:hypothetical protein
MRMAFVVRMSVRAQRPALPARRAVDSLKVAVWIAGVVAPWTAIILAARLVMAALA